jgi:glucose-6-phosphate 1-dehydrogenase
VRAQYGAGVVGGRIVRGYREEAGVAHDTHTETYAALELAVDNGRWRGVPFFLRSGKRLAGRCTEIAVHFKTPPFLLGGLTGETADAPVPKNVLVLRVQPDEGMSLTFATKVPGVVRALDPDVAVAPVDMRFDYDDAFGTEHHAAYETLLLDATIGDATLFTRSDEVATSWRLLDPLLEAWAADDQPLPTYAAGGWGPKEADALLAHHHLAWRVPGS